MSNRTNLIEAIRDAAGAVWPEVLANGILTAQEALRASYEQELVTPFAIIDVEDAPPSGEWGVANLTWTPLVSVYYLTDAETDSDAIEDKLALLENRIRGTALTFGQVIPRTSGYSTGRQLEANALLIQLNATQAAGQLRLQCLFGEMGALTDRFAGAPH